VLSTSAGNRCRENRENSSGMRRKETKQNRGEEKERVCYKTGKCVIRQERIGKTSMVQLKVMIYYKKAVKASKR